MDLAFFCPDFLRSYIDDEARQLRGLLSKASIQGLPEHMNRFQTVRKSRIPDGGQ